LFSGTFEHTIDAKGRTSLPVKLREQLAAAGESRIVLTRDAHTACIAAWPMSAWKKVQERVASFSPMNRLQQANLLRFYSAQQEVELDVHGRVLVPPALRQHGGLQKDVVWVGMVHTIQLWDKARYDAEMAKQLAPDEVIDLFAGAFSTGA